MREAGVLINTSGEPFHWHLPDDRSSVVLPDSQTLWDVIWENHKIIAGFAHSHPGSGWPGPSGTDITTFAAIEAGLGKHLLWWITSSNRFVVILWRGPNPHDYIIQQLLTEPPWVRKLREISGIYV